MDNYIKDFVREKTIQIENSTSEHKVKQHSKISDVYLASSDWPVYKVLNSFMSQVEKCDIFVNCGLAGYNFLLNSSPQKVIFIDINKFALFYALYLNVLVLLSNSRAQYFSFIYSKDEDLLEKQIKEKSGDQGFNKISSDAKVFQKNKEYFKSFAFSDELHQFQESFFKGTAYEDHFIPGQPLDQKRKLYLYHSDFHSFYAPHPVSFFMNHGWLESEESFLKFKNIIYKAKIDYFNFNLIDDPILNLINENDPEAKLLFYISNIGSTLLLDKEKEGFYQEFIIPKLQQEIKDEKLIKYYQKVIYQFTALSKFIKDLLRELHNFKIISQFGVFNKEKLLHIEEKYLKSL